MYTFIYVSLLIFMHFKNVSLTILKYIFENIVSELQKILGSWKKEIENLGKNNLEHIGI